ncbi:MAG: hypothetical protein DBY45_10630 [Clostridiales bacterium]|nr:MAG: hypothetical protein DBY45_10630 [Clostridiales bacterium]
MMFAPVMLRGELRVVGADAQISPDFTGCLRLNAGRYGIRACGASGEMAEGRCSFSAVSGEASGGGEFAPPWWLSDVFGEPRAGDSRACGASEERGVQGRLAPASARGFPKGYPGRRDSFPGGLQGCLGGQHHSA